MMDIHLRGVPGETVGKDRDERASLVALQHGFHHRAAVGPQHASVVMHVNACGYPHHSVNSPGTGPSKKAVLPWNPYAAHHIEPLFCLLNQFGNLLRRVLKIRVQGNHNISAHLGKSRHDGGVLPIISVEKDPDNVFLFLPGGLNNHLTRPVMASVINEDDFKSPSHLRADMDTASQKLIKVLFFIVDRNHHGNFQFPFHAFFLVIAYQHFTSFSHAPLRTSFMPSTTSSTSSKVISGKSGREQMRSEFHSVLGRTSLPIGIFS